jgi:hypothetical protein
MRDGSVLSSMNRDSLSHQTGDLVQPSKASDEENSRDQRELPDQKEQEGECHFYPTDGTSEYRTGKHASILTFPTAGPWGKFRLPERRHIEGYSVPVLY